MTFYNFTYSTDTSSDTLSLICDGHTTVYYSHTDNPRHAVQEFIRERMQRDYEYHLPALAVDSDGIMYDPWNNNKVVGSFKKLKAFTHHRGVLDFNPTLPFK